MLLTHIISLACIVILAIIKSVWTSGGSGWKYTDENGTGPLNWGNIYPICNGMRQSPINIQKNLTQYNSDLKPIELTTYWYRNAPGLDYTLENDGYGVKVKFQVRGNYVQSPIMTKYNGETWRLVQFHFHWSGENNTGSEHTIDGKAFPAELHLIHTNLKYNSSLGQAVKASDGLMVFGVFLELVHSSRIPLGNHQYRLMDRLFSLFRNVPYKGNISTLNEIAVGDVFTRETLRSYYTYPGSLTTPSCDETVRWVVFEHPLRVTMEEIKKLRALNSKEKSKYPTDKPMDENVIPRFRPVQPLNRRVVQRSFENIGPTGAAINIKSNLFTMLAFLLFVSIQVL